jgi:hypothetical protein
MNFIREIREAIDDNNEPVRFAFWENEMAVYIGDREIPISVLAKEGKVVLDVEGYDWALDCGQVQTIGKIMEILLDNMEEICYLTKSV